MDDDSPKGKQKQCPKYCSKNRHIYEQPMDGYAVYNVFQHIQLNLFLFCKLSAIWFISLFIS